jgi:hypothetical protein
VVVTAVRPERAAEQPLASVVDQLRAERDGLREAMRTRAVIEQAKGILMARHRIGADEAFELLRSSSQQTNVRLAEVAAGVVAQTGPPPRSATAVPSAEPAGQWFARSAPAARVPQPRVSGGVAGRARTPATGRRGADGDGLGAPPHTRHLLLRARLEAAGSYDDVVAELADTSLDWPPPSSVVLTLVEPDAALGVVASRGLPPEMASQWRRIPPQVDVPLTEAARSRASVWLADPDQIRRSYPVVLDMASGVGACVALPVAPGGGLLGVLGLTWKSQLDLHADRRSCLTAIAEATGVAVARLTGGAPPAPPDGPPDGPAAAPAPPWIQPLLDGSLTPAALLIPRHTGGAVTDFGFEHVNQAATDDFARRDIRLPGTSLLTALPDPGARTLLPLYLDVLRDGRPRQIDDLRLPGQRPGDPDEHYALRAVRLGERVLVTWRLWSPAEVLYDDLVAAGHAARVAAFHWHLATGELRGSPNLRSLLAWPVGTPLRVADALQVIDPAHSSAARAALVATLRTGVALAITVPTRQRHRWLRVVGERLTDASGRPIGLRGSVQDVSQLQSVQSRHHRLSEAQAADRRRAPHRRI